MLCDLGIYVSFLIVMGLPAVLLLMSLPLLTLVLGLGLGLGHHDEAVVLQLLDLVLPEVAHLQIRVRTVAILLLLLGNGLLLSVLGLVLTLLPGFLTLTALVTSSGLPVVPVLPVVSVFPVAVGALLVLPGLFCGLLLSLDGLCGLSKGSGHCLHCHHGFLLHLLSHCLHLDHLDGLGHSNCDHHGCNHWLRLGNNGSGSLNGDGFRLHIYLLLEDIIDDLLLIADDGGDLAAAVLLHVGSECLLEFAVIGEVLEGVGEGGDGFIEGGEVFALLEGVPEVGEFVALGQFGAGVEDGDGSGEDLQFLELNVAVNNDVLCVGLLEEGGGLFDTGTFLEECSLAVDLLDLFGLEDLLGLELGDLCEFLVDVAHLLLQGLQEGLVLLVYNLRAIFRILLSLWLWFF